MASTPTHEHQLKPLRMRPDMRYHRSNLGYTKRVRKRFPTNTRIVFCEVKQEPIAAASFAVRLFFPIALNHSTRHACFLRQIRTRIGDRPLRQLVGPVVVLVQWCPPPGRSALVPGAFVDKETKNQFRQGDGDGTWFALARTITDAGTTQVLSHALKYRQCLFLLILGDFRFHEPLGKRLVVRPYWAGKEGN